jgi:phage baseplate assembly protein W
MANLKMNKGIENLNSHLNDYGDILKDSTKKYTPQYSAALKDIRQDMADILDLNLSTLSDDFLTNEHNLELMKEAAKGNVQAIEELRIKAAQEIVLGVRFDEDGFSESETAVLAAINALTAEDLTIGCSLNNTQFGQSLYDAAVAAGSTVGDIREMFEALGWEPKIELKRVSVEEAQTMAGESTVDVIDPITGEVTPVKGDMIASFATNGFVTIPSINGDATIYKGGASETLTPKDPTGGGGGSKP